MKVLKTLSFFCSAVVISVLPGPTFAFNASCNNNNFSSGHFAEVSCSGCHPNGTPLQNFVSIQAGPNNMLLPNTVYQIRINAASMTAGRDAYKLQISNSSTGTSLGTLLDGPAGNPLPDTATTTNCKQGSKISETRNLNETFRDYYWRSPAGPQELPLKVTIRGFFMDGTGNGNGGEPQGIQEIELTNPNPVTAPDDSEDEDDEFTSSNGGKNGSSGGASGTGFSDLNSGCGMIRGQNETSSSSISLIVLSLMTALIFLRRRFISQS